MAKHTLLQTLQRGFLVASNLAHTIVQININYVYDKFSTWYRALNEHRLEWLLLKINKNKYVISQMLIGIELNENKYAISQMLIGIVSGL